MALFLFLLTLVLASVGCSVYLTVQWAVWHQQSKAHQAWSIPLRMGWTLLVTSVLLTWQCVTISDLTWQAGMLVIIAFCTSLVLFPYALSRYREMLAALAELPRYDDPQEGVWPPPPTDTP